MRDWKNKENEGKPMDKYKQRNGWKTIEHARKAKENIGKHKEKLARTNNKKMPKHAKTFRENNQKTILHPILIYIFRYRSQEHNPPPTPWSSLTFHAALIWGQAGLIGRAALVCCWRSTDRGRRPSSGTPVARCLELQRCNVDSDCWWIWTDVSLLR